MRKLDIKIIGNQKWLDLQSVDSEKLQSLNVAFVSPEYINYKNVSFFNFRKAYYENFMNLPNHYSYIGYELMNYFGHALKRYGTHFQIDWNNDFYKPTIFSKIEYDTFQTNQSCEITILDKGYSIPIKVNNKKCLKRLTI